jgi:peptidyl-prolyl cis-trans isomerase SurA
MKRTVRLLLPAVLLALLAPLVFAQSGSGVQMDPNRPNRVAARVEGQIITTEEIRREMAPLIPQVLRNAVTAEEQRRALRRLEQTVLENMINRILMLEEFRKDGRREIPQSVIENRLKDIIEQDFNGERERYLAYLQSRGQTVEEFREDIREELIINFMQGRMRRSQAEVSPERILEYYRQNQDEFLQEAQVRLLQIVLPASEGIALAEELRERILAGEPFREVAAAAYRDRPDAPAVSQGWVREEDLRGELAEAAFALGPGEVSEVIVLGDFIFLLGVEDVREPGVLPLAEVREEIEEILSQRLSREAQQRWLERLREKAFIEYYS